MTNAQQESGPVLPHAYEWMISEDIKWLIDNTKDCRERKHIIAELKSSVTEYRERGYMEAITKRLVKPPLEAIERIDTEQQESGE